MGGWLVTVAIFKEDSDDDEELRHVTYAVAVADPTEAVKLTMKDCGAKAAMLNCPLEKEQLQRLGVEPGKLIAIHDDAIDPIITRPRRH
ncbi:carbonic anhydrase [Bradyrhizobium elkanii]